MKHESSGRQDADQLSAQLRLTARLANVLICVLSVVVATGTLLHMYAIMVYHPTSLAKTPPGPVSLVVLGGFLLLLGFVAMWSYLAPLRFIARYFCAAVDQTAKERAIPERTQEGAE